MSHTTTVVYCTSARCKLVHYGGMTEWPEHDDLDKAAATADTTIVDMGESIGADVHDANKI